MSGTTKELSVAVEEYFADLPRVRAAGAATPERSLYAPSLRPDAHSVEGGL